MLVTDFFSIKLQTENPTPFFQKKRLKLQTGINNDND